MRKLQEKRHFMSSGIERFQWGNRFYPDITKEADNDGPPTTKHPELWTWPSVERSIEDGNSLEGLGKSLCDLDDDCSSIVELFFLMLDCYHGANGYLSSHATLPPGTSEAELRLVESRKHEGRALIDDLDQHGLRVLQQQLGSPWFTDLLRDICTSASVFGSTGGDQSDDGTLQTGSTADPAGRIPVVINRMMSDLNWWISKPLSHEVSAAEAASSPLWRSRTSNATWVGCVDV